MGAPPHSRELVEGQRLPLEDYPEPYQSQPAPPVPLPGAPLRQLQADQSWEEGPQLATDGGELNQYVIVRGDAPDEANGEWRLRREHGVGRITTTTDHNYQEHYRWKERLEEYGEVKHVRVVWQNYPEWRESRWVPVTLFNSVTLQGDSPNFDMDDMSTWPPAPAVVGAFEDDFSDGSAGSWVGSWLEPPAFEADSLQPAATADTVGGSDWLEGAALGIIGADTNDQYRDQYVVVNPVAVSNANGLGVDGYFSINREFGVGMVVSVSYKEHNPPHNNYTGDHVTVRWKDGDVGRVMGGMIPVSLLNTVELTGNTDSFMSDNTGTWPDPPDPPVTTPAPPPPVTTPAPAPPPPVTTPAPAPAPAAANDEVTEVDGDGDDVPIPDLQLELGPSRWVGTTVPTPGLRIVRIGATPAPPQSFTLTSYIVGNTESGDLNEGEGHGRKEDNFGGDSNPRVFTIREGTVTPYSISFERTHRTSASPSGSQYYSTFYEGTSMDGVIYVGKWSEDPQTNVGDDGDSGTFRLVRRREDLPYDADMFSMGAEWKVNATERVPFEIVDNYVPVGIFVQTKDNWDDWNAAWSWDDEAGTGIALDVGGGRAALNGWRASPRGSRDPTSQYSYMGKIMEVVTESEVLDHLPTSFFGVRSLGAARVRPEEKRRSITANAEIWYYPTDVINSAFSYSDKESRNATIIAVHDATNEVTLQWEGGEGGGRCTININVLAGYRRDSAIPVEVNDSNGDPWTNATEFVYLGTGSGVPDPLFKSQLSGLTSNDADSDNIVEWIASIGISAGTFALFVIGCVFYRRRIHINDNMLDEFDDLRVSDDEDLDQDDPDADPELGLGVVADAAEMIVVELEGPAEERVLNFRPILLWLEGSPSEKLDEYIDTCMLMAPPRWSTDGGRTEGTWQWLDQSMEHWARHVHHSHGIESILTSDPNMAPLIVKNKLCQKISEAVKANVEHLFDLRDTAEYIILTDEKKAQGELLSGLLFEWHHSILDMMKDKFMQRWIEMCRLKSYEHLRFYPGAGDPHRRGKLRELFDHDRWTEGGGSWQEHLLQQFHDTLKKIAKDNKDDILRIFMGLSNSVELGQLADKNWGGEMARAMISYSRLYFDRSSSGFNWETIKYKPDIFERSFRYSADPRYEMDVVRQLGGPDYGQYLHRNSELNFELKQRETGDYILTDLGCREGMKLSH
jgi:hypothetical protein